ncbi:MAG TPA: sialidase family protein [Gemmatimonadales bacterium]|nr:sialidase family protein [Gemmatimonadales bacterium]
MTRLTGVVLACAALGPVARPMGAQQPAAAPPLRLLRSHQISTGHPGSPHIESALALDPRDPKHMIAAAMAGRPGGKLGAYVYATFDGGVHWVASVIRPQDSSLVIGGDPIVHITRDGVALFGLGSRVDGKPATVISRSPDGGRSWASPVAVGYRDRPYMAFDTTDNSLRGTIYLGGQFGPLVLSHSTDGARSFSFPQLISRDLGGSDPLMPIRGVLTDLIVTPAGVLVMPFISNPDMRDSVPRAQDSVSVLQFRILVSDDGGQSFLGMREGPQMHSVKGFRGQQTVGAPRATVDQTRGAHRGRIFLVWSDWDAGRNVNVIRLGWSDDLGKSWKSSVVNDDSSGRDPGNPAVAVSRDGVVGVIWNDRRDDPNNQCWRLYAAVSTDGGATFKPNVKLSDAPTCTNAPGNWVLSAWYQYDYWSVPDQPRPGFGLTAMVPTRFPNGGDTQGLAADAAGVFHAAWINGATGSLQLWYTAFAVDSGLLATVRTENAQHATGTATAAVPAGAVDLTQELIFEVSAPTIDFAHGTLEVVMRVVNPTARVVKGPIEVRVDRLLSESDNAMGLANFKVANADNGQDGIGASWTWSLAPGGTLAPKGKTPPRVLRFRFTGGIPREPQGYFQPAFRIFGH